MLKRPLWLVYEIIGGADTAVYPRLRLQIARSERQFEGLLEVFNRFLRFAQIRIGPTEVV
jgi:hypothetical protein